MSVCFGVRLQQHCTVMLISVTGQPHRYYTRPLKKKKQIRMSHQLDLLRHGTGKSLCLSVYRCLLESPFIFAFPDSLPHISLSPYKQKNRERARGDSRGNLRAHVLWDWSGGAFWSYANEEPFGTTNLTVISIYPLTDSPPTFPPSFTHSERVEFSRMACWREAVHTLLMGSDGRSDSRCRKLYAGLWPETSPTCSL